MINAELYWSRVDRHGTNECWPYKTAKPGTYGQFWVATRSRGAHRIAFELWWGVDLPRHLHVCHNCPGGDNKTCCNPAHLLIGDNKWHAADKKAKGQTPGGRRNGAHTKSHKVRRGEANGMSKLNWARVGYIRQKYAAGTVSQSWLAKLLGVMPTTICAVLKERIWKPDQQPADGP